MTVPVSATSSSLFLPNDISYHHFLCYLGQKSNRPGHRPILLKWFVAQPLTVPTLILWQINTLVKESSIQGYDILSISSATKDLDGKLLEVLESLSLDLEGKLIRFLTIRGKILTSPLSFVLTFPRCLQALRGVIHLIHV